MLERLAADPAYGEAYREAVLANIVSEEQNVRQVSAKIALGEGDAGIVYVSDVTPDIRDQVIALPIANSLNTIATYPIAATSDTPSPELADAFIAFVLSDAGQAVLMRWGFVPVRPPKAPTSLIQP
jgi:molybdate transport system substrate-binding protein